MEENELYDRIGETDLNPTYKDGQTYQHTDINQMLGILKTAINENYYDIQRLLNGAKTVGNANQLEGATLSRYVDETLQADDNKIPSSQQAKAYMDDLFAGYSAPVRGEDYWTDADKEEIIDDTTTAVIEEITPSFEEALAAKANINDIPTKISDLQNDSDFLSENNLQMVNVSNVQNGSQITDATGYCRLNKIYGNTSQTGTPTPSNIVNVDVVTGYVEISIANSDNTLTKNYLLSLGDIELCQLGDYKDYLFKNNGNWYKYKVVNKYILTGASDENWYLSNQAIKCNTLNTRLGYPDMNEGYNYLGHTTLPLYSNFGTVMYAQYIPNNASTGLVGLSNSTNGGGDTDAIYLSKANYTLESFKNLLAITPLICYYVLANPIIEEITDMTLINQLNEIYNISLYSTETNFSITSDNLIPTLNITYAITNRDFYSKEQMDDIIEAKTEEMQEDYLIHEITYEKINVENNKGTVYITKIPHLDNEDKLIPIKHGFANDEIDNGVETPTSFSARNNCTFVSNASVFEITGTEHIALNELKGVYIHNGILLKDNRQYSGSNFVHNRYILGVKENNVLKSYLPQTSVEDLLADGVKETFQAFIPILINGQNNRSNLINEGCTYWENSTFSETEDQTPNYDKIYYTLENGEYIGHFHLNSFNQDTTYYDETSSRYARQIIGQCENGDIIFITNNGKGEIYNVGLTLYDFTTLAQYYNCKFAFVLDGGGSTSSVYKNEMLNHPTDNQTDYSKCYNGLGYTERKVPDFIYFSKEIKKENEKDINYLLMKIQELQKRVDDLILANDNKFMSNTNFYELENQQHIFNFNKWDNEIKDFISTFRMYIDNPNGEFAGGMSINYIDEENNSIPVLRFGKEMGISFLSKKLGLIFNDIPKLPNDADLNNLPDLFTFARADRDQNLNGAPITDSSEGYNYFILQFGFSTIYRVQVAFSLKLSPIVMKVRCYTSSWGEWQKVSFET